MTNLLKSQYANWREWIDTRAIKHTELANVNSALSEAQEALRRMSMKVVAVTKEANEHAGARIPYNEPSQADRHLVLTALSQLQVQRRAHVSNDQLALWAHHAKALSLAEQALQSAQQTVDELAEQSAQLKQELADLDTKQPKADERALELFSAEMADAEAEQARIEQILYSLGGEVTDDSAQAELEAAQSKLDELEALAALGENTNAEQKTAQATLTRAKNKAQAELEEANRKASARRGLERKLKAQGEQVAELGKMRDQIALLFHGERLAQQEQELIDYLLDGKLTKLMGAIRDTREKMTELTPGGRYLLDPLEITLPHIYLADERDTLSRSKLSI